MLLVAAKPPVPALKLPDRRPAPDAAVPASKTPCVDDPDELRLSKETLSAPPWLMLIAWPVPVTDMLAIESEPTAAALSKMPISLPSVVATLRSEMSSPAPRSIPCWLAPVTEMVGREPAVPKLDRKSTRL